MNATEAMERIEGHAFSATVNLAGDFPTFLRILASQPEVRALSDEMNSECATLDVFARVGELAASPAEEGYEHPADSSLAAYLWLLGARNGDYSARAVETVLECKQCWWARKMAEYVRSQNKPENFRKLYRSINAPDTLIACKIGANEFRERRRSTMNVDWETRIILNPSVLAGKPTIRGLRISVEQLLRALSAGVPAEEILAEYPDLELEDLRACQAYAADVIASERAYPISSGV